MPRKQQLKRGSHERYHVPNLKRALEVFELLAKNPDGLTIPEIVKITHYSKSSTFRIVCTLEDCGYVVNDARVVRMSRKLAALGYAAFGESNIVEKSMDVIRSMRDDLGETAMLGTMLEDECVMIEQAPGKAILAYLPKDELARKLANMKFVKFNENTITNLSDFKKELEKVRACGYSVDNGEEIEGVNCVGAPIFDAHGYPIASIWITGPQNRIGKLDFESIGAKVRNYANIISARLGYGLI